MPVYTTPITLYRDIDYDGDSKLTIDATRAATEETVHGATGVFRLLHHSKHELDDVEADLEIATETISHVAAALTIPITIARADMAALETSPPNTTGNYQAQVVASIGDPAKEYLLVDSPTTIKKTVATTT